MSGMRVEILKLRDEHLLFSYLDEYLNANGDVPHAVGYDDDERPFMVWLNEVGGDEVIGRVVFLTEDDGGTTESVTDEEPLEVLTYPVRMLVRGRP